MTEIVSRTLEDTAQIAAMLAKKVNPGCVVALVGQMGAGKTAFSKAFAKALGINQTVNSPTFNILNTYDDGRIPMYHFDAYRIEESEEMYEIGFEEYIYGNGVCVIEWADVIKDILPRNYILVKIDVFGENKRIITIEEKNGL